MTHYVYFTFMKKKHVMCDTWSMTCLSWHLPFRLWHLPQCFTWSLSPKSQRSKHVWQSIHLRFKVSLNHVHRRVSQSLIFWHLKLIQEFWRGYLISMIVWNHHRHVMKHYILHVFQYVKIYHVPWEYSYISVKHLLWWQTQDVNNAREKRHAQTHSQKHLPKLPHLIFLSMGRKVSLSCIAHWPWVGNSGNSMRLEK